MRELKKGDIDKVVNLYAIESGKTFQEDFQNLIKDFEQTDQSNNKIAFAEMVSAFTYSRAVDIIRNALNSIFDTFEE